MTMVNIYIWFLIAGSPQEFDKFAIEKWPLIQVYGVEGVGR